MKRGLIYATTDAPSHPLHPGVWLSQADELAYKHGDMESSRLVCLKAAVNDISTLSLRTTKKKPMNVEGTFDVMGDVCKMDT